MSVAWKNRWLVIGCAAVLVSGCTSLFSAPIKYLPKDPPPGAIPYGEKVYVDDGKCPDGLVKLLIGGDAKRNIPRHVECVSRP